MYYVHIMIDGKHTRTIRDLGRILDEKNPGDIWVCGMNPNVGYIERYEIVSKKIANKVFSGVPLYEVEAIDRSHFDESIIIPRNKNEFLFDPVGQTYVNARKSPKN